MTSTVFQSGTVIASPWLNDVNNHVYSDTPISPATTVHSASNISNVPSGTIASTTVQAAINEIVTDLSASSGSSTVGFLQSGTGATARTVQNKNRDIISVKDFGAVGDGVTDDTTAIQNAHNTGKLIYYPSGTYLFTPTITIVSGGIIGDGPTNTILKSNDVTTANLIKYTGALGTYSNIPTFHNFTLLANGSKTSGAGLQVLPATGESSYLDFHNVHFVACPIGIDFVAASLWKVIGCDFLSYSVAGIQVANTNVADSGDSVIQGCVFNTPNTTGHGVLQKSSGGLKIIGNKFLGGLRGYTMNLEGSTSVLLIAGNSFENMAGADVSFAQGIAGRLFKNVAITGNEFSVGGVAVNTDATGFLSEFIMTGNIVNMGAVGSNACIALNSVTDFYIGSNFIKGNGGALSSAINLTSCVNGKIGINTYANLPTPLVIASSPTVITELDSQSGSSTTSAAGWSGYGTLFISASTTVTFANPFTVTPSITDVTITPGSNNGTLGGIVTSISKTGFTYQAISSVTGIAATVYWKVEGTI